MLFPSDSYELLQRLAAGTQRTISAVVRETIEEQLIQALRGQEKEQALARLCSGDTPVEGWEAMERDIEKRWEQCRADDSASGCCLSIPACPVVTAFTSPSCSTTTCVAS